MHGNRKSISRSEFDLKREAENEADKTLKALVEL